MSLRHLLLNPMIGGFLPTDLSNLQLWLDGNDPATLFQDTGFTIPASSDGDVVGGWQDKSGNVNDAIQATVAQKPLLRLNAINSKPGLEADGADDHIDASSVVADFASDFTIFVVAEPTGGNFDTFYSSAAFRFQTNNITLTNLAGQVNFALALAPQIVAVRWQVGVSLEVFRDGVSLGIDITVGVPNSGVDLQLMRDELSGLGGSDQFVGDISEAIVYERALATVERQSVEAYLSSKWSIPLA